MRAISGEFLSKKYLWMIISESGLKVSYEETGKFEGGFIVSTEEFELDCTTHTLIYNNREGLESKVTSVLFS